MRAAVLALAVCAACASSGPYPNDPQEKTFAADRDNVYDAMVRTLQGEGYVLHVSDPHRMRVEGKAGDRVVMMQGIDKGGKVLVRIGAVRVEARDFRRLWMRLKRELKD